jgi:beta-phosphoglucomutase-like phosphatase (HAD superfamily)
MDGVIADTEPLHGGCFIKAFDQFGINTTLEDYRQAVTLGGSAVKDYFIHLGGDVAIWDDVKAIKDAHLIEMMISHCNPMPGVTELLESLKAEDIPTVLATSARRKSVEIVIGHLSLGHISVLLSQKTR